MGNTYNMNMNLKEKFNSLGYDLIICNDCDILKIYSNEIRKYGIADKNGIILCQPRFSEIFLENCINQMVIVKENGLYGIINKRGEFVMSCIFSKIEKHPNGLILFYGENERHEEIIGAYICSNGLLIKNEKLIYEIKPINDRYSFECCNESDNIIDGNGRIVLSLKKDSCNLYNWHCQCYGHCVCFENFYKGYGLINEKDEIYFIKQKRFNVKNEVLLSDRTIHYSEMDIKHFEYFGSIKCKDYFKYENIDGYYHIINDEFAIILKDLWKIDEFEEGDDGYFYSMIETDQGCGWVDANFTTVIPAQYKWVGAIKNGWCLITDGFDRPMAIRSVKGKEIILNPPYDWVDDTFHNGLLKVCHCYRGYGFIDEEGNEIIRCKYHFLDYFDGDFAKARFDTEYGLINRNGELLVHNGERVAYIPATYDWGWDYHYGCAIVQRGLYYGLISEDGYEILPCLYSKIEYKHGKRFLLEKENLTRKQIEDSKKSIQQMYVNEKGFFIIGYENRDILVKRKYDWIYPFVNGFARVEIGKSLGYINEKGEELIFFDDAEMIYDFSCGLALVKFSNKSFAFINKFGLIRLKISDLSYCYDYSSIYNHSFDGNLVLLRKNNVKSYLILKGIKISVIYSFINNIAIAMAGGKYGIINMDGEVLFPFVYDYLEYIDISGLIKVNKDGKVGIFNSEGRCFIPCVYNDLNKISSDPILFEFSTNEKIASEEKIGVINLNNETIIPDQYISIKQNFPSIYNHDGKATLFINNSQTDNEVTTNRSYKMKYGALTLNYSYVLYKIENLILFAGKPNDGGSDYELLNINLILFYNGFFIFEKGRFYSLDNSSNIKFNFIHSISSDEQKQILETMKVKDSSLFIFIDSNHKYGYTNHMGTLIIPCKYDEGLAFINGRASVRKGKFWGCISENDEIIIPFEYESPFCFVNSISIAKKKGLYGFIDNNGVIVSFCIYDSVRDYKNGMAAVCRDQLWGYINEKGEEAISCQYSLARDFSEGLAYVYNIHLKSNSGFINRKGDLVINIVFPYTDISDFYKGEASATKEICIPGRDDIDITITKGARLL